jgi:hypothetical protein
VSDGNPLRGVSGRADLLRRLGRTTMAAPEIFGREDTPRPGGLFDHFVSLADGGCLVVTDAVPYVDNPRERAFSALFSYLHESSMDVCLPTERLWRDAFGRAGFGEVTSEPLGMPGSRVFTAAV